MDLDAAILRFANPVGGIDERLALTIGPDGHITSSDAQGNELVSDRLDPAL